MTQIHPRYVTVTLQKSQNLIYMYFTRIAIKVIQNFHWVTLVVAKKAYSGKYMDIIFTAATVPIQSRLVRTHDGMTFVFHLLHGA